MKLAGCATVFVCCFLLGFVFSEKERRALEICEEICELAARLEAGISKRIPLCEIISRFRSELSPKHLTEDSRRELLRCLEDLKEINGCRECADKCITLLTFVGRCPDAYRCSEKCTETASELREILAEKRKSQKNKSTLFPKLGAILGILICIILI